MINVLYIGAIWICVWLLVTLLTLALNLTGLEFPMPARTGIMTALLVPTMVYGIIPRLRALMKK